MRLVVSEHYVDIRKEGLATHLIIVVILLVEELGDLAVGHPGHIKQTICFVKFFIFLRQEIFFKRIIINNKTGKLERKMGDAR